MPTHNDPDRYPSDPAAHTVVRPEEVLDINQTPAPEDRDQTLEAAVATHATRIDGPNRTVAENGTIATAMGRTRAGGGIRGDQFGRYQIVKELARGGMGIIYVANDPELRRQVALKVLIAGEGATAQTIGRFIREARAASKLRHPNIVPVYEAGEIDGLHYFTMDLVRGRELGDVMDKLSRRQKATILFNVAKALDYAHKSGVIHRDLKPGNVMIDLHGRTFVMDFGLAKDLDSNSLQSVTGSVMGTPAYMSTEQAQGLTHDIDHRTDIYSLGTMAYELFSGERPFEGDTLFDIMYQVVHKQPPPLRAVCTGPKTIDEGMERIVMRCLEKNPDQRYLSMEALADDLKAWLKEGGEAVSARRIGFGRRVWRWIADRPALRYGVIGGGPVALVLAGIALWYLLSGGVLSVAATEIASADPIRMRQGVELLSTRRQAGELASSSAQQRISGLVLPLVGAAGVDASTEGAALRLLTGLDGSPGATARQQLRNPLLALALAEAGSISLDRRQQAFQFLRLLCDGEGAKRHGLDGQELAQVADLVRGSGGHSHKARLAAARALVDLAEAEEPAVAAAVALAGDESLPSAYRVAVLAAAGQHLSLHDRSLGAVMALSGDDDPAVAATAMDAIDGIRTRDSILHAYGLAPQASSAAATMGKVMALTAATNRLAAELEAEIDGRDQVAQEKLGDAPVLVVARRLRSADEGERLLGCYDIGRLADGRAFPSLVQALSDPAASVRGAAVAAIARVAAEMPKGTNPARQPVPLQAIRHLALNANQAETRLAASRSLGRLEDQGIVPAFVERLRGAEINRAVQVAQIRALGRIGADIGLEALQDMVDRHPDERGLAAIDALAERKGWEGRALPLLVSTLDHESQRLRDAAEGALVRIAGDESMAGSGSAAWRQWLGAQGRP